MESRAASEREESRHGNITNNDESAIPGTYVLFTELDWSCN